MICLSPRLARVELPVCKAPPPQAAEFGSPPAASLSTSPACGSDCGWKSWPTGGGPLRPKIEKPGSPASHGTAKCLARRVAFLVQLNGFANAAADRSAWQGLVFPSARFTDSLGCDRNSYVRSNVSLHDAFGNPKWPWPHGSKLRLEFA